MLQGLFCLCSPLMRKTVICGGWQHTNWPWDCGTVFRLYSYAYEHLYVHKRRSFAYFSFRLSFIFNHFFMLCRTSLRGKNECNDLFAQMIQFESENCYILEYSSYLFFVCGKNKIFYCMIFSATQWSLKCSVVTLLFSFKIIINIIIVRRIVKHTHS